MKDFVERLRAKPEDVRRAIALSAAAAVTGIVALGWAIALVSSGDLALSPAAPSDTGAEETFAEGQARWNELAGAAAAFNETGSPELVIVEENRSSTLDPAPQPTETVIHF